MRKLQTEIRECVECGDTYDWNQRNIYCLCVSCRKRHYRKAAKKKPEDYKKPYPLNENEKRRRYRNIVNDLNKAETREERREIYARELEFMVESGIWLWCIDIRFSNQIIDKGSGKRGRKPLDRTAYPNTKDWYE